MCDTPSPYSTPHIVAYTCCTHINLLDRWCSWYYLFLNIERKWMKYQLDQPSKQEFSFLSLVPILTQHTQQRRWGLVIQREVTQFSSFCWMNDKSPLGILCAQLQVFFHPLFLVLYVFFSFKFPSEIPQKVAADRHGTCVMERGEKPRLPTVGET